ncbi:MAG: hypothetical protein AB8H47_28410 [Bacteroidia bacterium]
MKDLHLSFPRLGLVLRNDLLKFYKPILLASVIFIGFTFLDYVAQVNDFVTEGGSPRIHHNESFGLILLIGGFVFSSFAFYELNHKEKGMRYLLAPASQLEKWLSRFIFTSGVFALYVWLLYGLITIIFSAIAQSFWGLPMTPFEWMGEDTLFLLRLYLVLQSIFIAGSIFLGRFSFLLTPITIGVIGLVLFVVAIIYIRILLIGLTEGWDLSLQGRYKNSTEWESTIQFTLIPLLEQAFWWTLAPFFWVVSYVRLTEKER